MATCSNSKKRLFQKKITVCMVTCSTLKQKIIYTLYAQTLGVCSILCSADTLSSFSAVLQEATGEKLMKAEDIAEAAIELLGPRGQASLSLSLSRSLSRSLSHSLTHALSHTSS